MYPRGDGERAVAGLGHDGPLRDPGLGCRGGQPGPEGVGRVGAGIEAGPLHGPLDRPVG